MKIVQLAELKEVISGDRLIAFFRAAQASAYPPMSVKEICRTVEEKGSLQAAFDHYADNNAQLDLSINKLDADRYEISFGFMGSSLDDGGMWAVEYDAHARSFPLNSPVIGLASAWYSLRCAYPSMRLRFNYSPPWRMILSAFIVNVKQ